MEKARALRTKLRWLGIPLARDEMGKDRATIMLCDNESVVKSTTRSEASLNKKHQAICWHAVREAMACGWLQMVWQPTDLNLADLFTKLLPGPTRKRLIGRICPSPGSKLEILDIGESMKGESEDSEGAGMRGAKAKPTNTRRRKTRN